MYPFIWLVPPSLPFPEIASALMCLAMTKGDIMPTQTWQPHSIVAGVIPTSAVGDRPQPYKVTHNDKRGEGFKPRMTAGLLSDLIYAFYLAVFVAVKLKLSSCRPTATASPSLNSPCNILVDSGFSTYLWIARRKGRAPYTGS